MNDTTAVCSRQYQIRELQAGDESRWDAFVVAHDSGTFYHLSGWKRIIENSLHHPTSYLYCESEGVIVAVLPLVHIKSLFFGNSYKCI